MFCYFIQDFYIYIDKCYAYLYIDNNRNLIIIILCNIFLLCIPTSVVSLKFDNSSMLALAEPSIQSPGGFICGVLNIQQVHPTKADVAETVRHNTPPTPWFTEVPGLSFAHRLCRCTQHCGQYFLPSAGSA
jgi:hypothetical protein